MDIDWSPQFAYAIGLLTTDGSLSIDGRHIVFTSSDLQLIESLRDCLGKTNRITDNPRSRISVKDVYRIQIGDVKLYRFLLRIGLTPNKSLTLGKLQIPEKYFADFLRGHIDGDGSIIYYKDYYNTKINMNYVYDRLFVCFLSASKNHIEWLKEDISDIFSLQGSISINKPNSQIGKSPTYRLKYSTNAAKILVNLMYYKTDIPMLARKYMVAKQFLKMK